MPQKILSENFEKVKKESLKGDYAVYKPDPILLMRDNMKLTQMRFFEAYLSKIDAKNPDTYKVRIPLDKVAELANVDLSNRSEVNKMCEDIENSRFDFKRYKEKYEPEKIDPKKQIIRETFPLFDKFLLVKDEGEYYIEVIPGVTMSEMLQQYQKNYATYELQEIYSLSKKPYMRMYSCFKRLQKFETTKISIELLKSYLGLDEKSYERPTDVRKFFIEPGIKEINEKTDITVTYKPYRKGRNIVGWSFTIKAKDSGQSDNTPEERSTFDFVEPEIGELTQEQKELQELRADLKNGSVLTEDELSDIKFTLDNCEYIQDMSFHTLNLAERKKLTKQYLRAQESYTLARLRKPERYYTYLVGAIKGNYNQISGWWDKEEASSDKPSYDMDEFKRRADKMPVYKNEI